VHLKLHYNKKNIIQFCKTVLNNFSDAILHFPEALAKAAAFLPNKLTFCFCKIGFVPFIPPGMCSGAVHIHLNVDSK
jgi:hypothetical protein